MIKEKMMPEEGEGLRFGFGQNRPRYLGLVGDERFGTAMQSLRDMLEWISRADGWRCCNEYGCRTPVGNR